MRASTSQIPLNKSRYYSVRSVKFGRESLHNAPLIGARSMCGMHADTYVYVKYRYISWNIYVFHEIRANERSICKLIRLYSRLSETSFDNPPCLERIIVVRRDETTTTPSASAVAFWFIVLGLICNARVTHRVLFGRWCSFIYFAFCMRFVYVFFFVVLIPWLQFVNSFLRVICRDYRYF